MRTRDHEDSEVFVKLVRHVVEHGLLMYVRELRIVPQMAVGRYDVFADGHEFEMEVYVTADGIGVRAL